ncbi:MAG: Crp/Fnr family transcriptional regulator [Methylophilaceae bacterium]
MAALLDPRQNHLLSKLSPAVYGRLFPHLELIPMPSGKRLYEADDPLGYVYFPTTSIVSLLYATEDGDSTEIAVVGNCGVIGIALFMGGFTMPHSAVVQNAGYAYRLRGHLLMDDFNRAGGRRNGELRDLLLLYTQALITQMAQTAVCNRHHTIEQQVCRRLLLSLDRLTGNVLNITQEQLANMLGVRRESITTAAGVLQRAGLIDCSRGRIAVLNRAGLEEHCCECYQVVKTEHERLFPIPDRAFTRVVDTANGFKMSFV